MRTDRILENESAECLSARLGVPVCMLLRANRLTCVAWLTSGREICVPEGDFCQNDSFPCPARLFGLQARDERTEVFIAGEEDTVEAAAQEMGTTERLIILARGRPGPLCEGERILIGAGKCQKRIGSVLVGETIDDFCKRFGAQRETVLEINMMNREDVWPGMRLVLPG